MTVFSSLSSLGACWRPKSKRASHNHLSSQLPPQEKSPSKGKERKEPTFEPRLVLVRPCTPERPGEPKRDAVYGTPLRVREFSSSTASPHLLPCRSVATSQTNGMVLPADILGMALQFAPVQVFTQFALVCRNWNTVTKRVAQLNLKEAKDSVTKGLQLMATTNYPTESVELFSHAINMYPKFTEASFWRAKGLFILNEEAQAVRCLESALAQRPKAVERLKLQACIFYAQNNDLKASQLLEAALQKTPNDASIHFELGFCYHGLQQFGRAVASYTRANELNYHRTFVLLANRANCLFRLNKIDEALADLEASLVISPHYELALRTRAFVNMHLGNSHLAYKDYTAITENAKTPKVVSDAFCNRAFCYGEMDEGDIELARAADPTNPEPVRYKASALVTRNQAPEAIVYVTNWISANKTHKDVAFQLAFRGELHVSVSDWANAVKDYQEAIALLLTSPASLNYGGANAADTLVTYRERLRDLLQEQRRAAAHA